MQDPSHYRLEAQKFVEQARNAKSSEHRLILLQEAQTMIRLAEQAEMMQRIVDNQLSVAKPQPA
jgi:hypothetical protein